VQKKIVHKVLNTLTSEELEKVRNVVLEILDGMQTIKLAKSKVDNQCTLHHVAESKEPGFANVVLECVDVQVTLKIRPLFNEGIKHQIKNIITDLNLRQIPHQKDEFKEILLDIITTKKIPQLYQSSKKASSTIKKSKNEKDFKNKTTYRKNKTHLCIRKSVEELPAPLLQITGSPGTEPVAFNGSPGLNGSPRLNGSSGTLPDKNVDIGPVVLGGQRFKHSRKKWRKMSHRPRRAVRSLRRRPKFTMKRRFTK
jgi:hypothetical protein